MKLYEKYPVLRERDYVISMLVENVYATMQLESQPVPEQTLRQLAERIFDESLSKRSQLLPDQLF